MSGVGIAGLRVNASVRYDIFEGIIHQTPIAALVSLLACVGEAKYVSNRH